MRLAADLGGTHARFALQSEVVTRVDLAARDFADLDAAIESALATLGVRETRAIDAVLAVAGPVHGSTAAFTNLGWQADAPALRERFGFASVRLVNDVACAARGAAVSLPDDVVSLQSAPRREHARHGLVSVGTGLGVAYWHTTAAIEASEAGHTGFAPANDWDRALLDFLQDDAVRVTWEHALSGSGLARVAAFVSGTPCDDGAQVSRRADHGDPYALESIRQFSRLLGVFTGDLVLSAPVTGGVLLAGGVIAGLGDRFDGDAFIAGFRDKAAVSTQTAAVPVWRTADTALALRGALL